MDSESTSTPPQPSEDDFSERGSRAEGASGALLSRSRSKGQPQPAIPGVSYLPDATSTEQVYCRLLSIAAEEILVFNRPPYAWAMPELHPTILEMLGRGIPTRVLYRRVDLERPEAAGFREETAAYIEAGVQARVVETLPMKLLVMDRRVALLAMMEPAPAEEDFPASMHIEHPGLAKSLADVFERYWATAQPYVAEPVLESRPGSA